MEEKKDFKVNGIYRLLHTVILSCVLIFAGKGFWGISEPSLLHAAVAGLTAALLLGVSFLRGRARALYLGALAGCMAMAILAAGAISCAEFARAYGSWLMGTEGYREEQLWAYRLLQTVWISAGCYLAQTLFEKYPPLQRGLACLIPPALVMALWQKRELSHIGAVLLIWYFAMVCMEWIQDRWKKIRSRQDKRPVLWVMPFMAVYLVLMLLMPAPAKAYDWGFAKSIYKAVSETVIRLAQTLTLGDREDFGMAMSGFSENGRLFGGFREEDELVMTVTAQFDSRCNVYLMGKVFDTFDGREWTLQSEESERDRLLDTMETVYALQKYDSNTADYLYGSKLTVRFEHFNTGYLFAPLKTWQISGAFAYGESGGNLLFDRKMGYGTEYELQFFQMNVDHPGFYRFVQEKTPDDREAWAKATLRFLERGEEIPLSTLLEHREKIRQSFAGEVEPGPRVQQWMEEVTAGADTDIEKLKYLENALSELNYSTSPGKLPEAVTNEAEFLDYFILESREGYCSYFATAFVLLARAEGFPARYVQGFCIPLEGRSQTSVYSRMAHAWPEVYIEGIGWLPFEPTPGYGELRYTPWEMTSPVSASGSGTGSIHYWQQEEPAVTGKAENVSPQESAEKVSENVFENGRLWQLLGAAVLMVVVVAGLMLGMDCLAAGRRYKKMNERQKFEAQVYRNMQILTLLGCRKKEFWTLSEWKKELDGELWFIEDYEKVIYGNCDVTEDMTKCAAEQGRELLERLKRRKGKRYPYYYLKLLFGTQGGKGGRNEGRRAYGKRR